MPNGSVKFTADTSAFNAPLKEAAQSALGVASAAEEARKRIVASYQLQVRAAQEAGASQRDLAAITRQVTSMTANVNEENARRYINAVDRMEDRTRRFNAARSVISNVPISDPISQFTFGGNATKEAEEFSHAIDGVGKSTGYAVAPSVRFGSVLRGMEGGFSRNIRAAEYFGASLGFLEPIMATAFPIIGAATLGYALIEMGKHAYEAFENIVMLKGAIEGLNQLQITVGSNVDKNKDAAEDSVESILQATQGRAASLRQKYSYQSQKPLDMSSYFYSKEFKGLPTDVKANYESLYKSVAPADVPSRLQSITGEVTKLHEAMETIKTSGAFVPKVDGFGPGITQDPTKYFEARLKAAEQVKSQLVSGSTAHSASLQNLQIEIPKAQQDEQKKAAQESASAQRAALAAKKALDTAAIHQQDTAFLEWGAAQGRSKVDEVLYWSSFVAITDDGSARALDARKKYLQANVSLNHENAQSMKTAISGFSNEYMSNFYKNSGLSDKDIQKLGSSSKDALDYANSMRDQIDLTKQDSDALAENAIQMAVATGQMTKLDAARATAALHQQQYVDSLKELHQQADTINADAHLSPVERQAQLNNNENQTKSLNDNYYIQQQRDRQSYDPATTSMLTGASDALSQFAIASRDGAKMMGEVVNSTLRSLNNQIVSGATGGKTNFGQVGMSALRGVAGAGLEKAEGSVLGIFGKLGTKQNPMYTISASSGADASALGSLIPSSTGSGVAGFFGGLMKTVLPFLATGGDFSNGAIVGENGPEFLSGSGHVTSNRNLRSMMGDSGGSSISYTIDARGTDPVQTEQRVRSAIVASHQSSVTQAVRQVSQNASRTPARR